MSPHIETYQRVCAPHQELELAFQPVTVRFISSGHNERVIRLFQSVLLEATVTVPGLRMLGTAPMLPVGLVGICEEGAAMIDALSWKFNLDGIRNDPL